METERLMLRQFTVDDVDLLWALDNDTEVMRTINGGAAVARDVIREQTLPRFLASYDREEHYGVWATLEKASDRFLGWLWFKPASESLNIRPTTTDPHIIEIGWRLHQFAWGHGYAPEGARALMRQGFVAGDVQQVVAHTLATNTKSIRVMEKVGLRLIHTFIYEGTPGAWHVGQAAVTYGVNRDEWLQDE
ncbi:MAG: GNAT family N-acetyltransferase [Herpetosiphonaceae bacterium]|nr:GNAT family N-acetyltransferase [Herpetosiphonaceae bacterium]